MACTICSLACCRSASGCGCRSQRCASGIGCRTVTWRRPRVTCGVNRWASANGSTACGLAGYHSRRRRWRGPALATQTCPIQPRAACNGQPSRAWRALTLACQQVGPDKDNGLKEQLRSLHMDHRGCEVNTPGRQRQGGRAPVWRLPVRLQVDGGRQEQGPRFFPRTCITERCLRTSHVRTSKTDGTHAATSHIRRAAQY